MCLSFFLCVSLFDIVKYLTLMLSNDVVHIVELTTHPLSLRGYLKHHQTKENVLPLLLYSSRHHLGTYMHTLFGL